MTTGGAEPTDQHLTYWQAVDRALSDAGLSTDRAWDQTPDVEPVYLAWSYPCGHPALNLAWGVDTAVDVLWDETGWHWTDTPGRWRPLTTGSRVPDARQVAAAVGVLTAHHLDRLPVAVTASGPPRRLLSFRTEREEGA